MICKYCKRELPDKNFTTENGCIWCDFEFNRNKGDTMLKLKPLKFFIDEDLNTIEYDINHIKGYEIDDNQIKIYTDEGKEPIVLNRNKMYYTQWRHNIEILHKYFLEND